MAKILVVDDRPINCEFLKTLLGYGGHVTYQAANGIEALSVARTVLPDLVISDIMMPEMDGVELALAMRADPALAGTPVIFFTATYRAREARKLGESCGVTTVLAKPAKPQVILDAVHAILGTNAPPAPAAPSAIAPPATGAVAQRLALHLQDLAEMQLRMRELIKQSLAIVGAPAPVDDAGEALATALDETAARTLMRLTALIELGLDVASERNAAGLLELFCRATQDIMSAHYVGVGILDADDHRLALWACRGLSDETDAAFAKADPLAGLLGQAVATGRPQRLTPGALPTAAGLPADHPPIADMLAVPVRSPARNYGWIYLANKLAGEGFGDDDVRVASTLAAQLALAYENLALYEEQRRYSGQLETESAERRRAEIDLRASEERYRQLADNIREVFFIVDRSGTEMIYISPGYELIWGRSCASLYANPVSWIESVHPDDRGRAEDVLVQTASQGQFDAEYRIIRPDGTVRWIRSRGFPIRNEAGEMYRLAGLAEDVTERHAQEERIARLTRVYAVLSGINSAIVRIHERQALLFEACRIAVEAGGFVGAWIGLRDAESAEIRRNASRGIEPQTFPSGQASDVVAKVLRTGRAVTYREPPADGDVSRSGNAWADRAVVALPLTLDGRVAGAFVMCADKAALFDPDEMRLLEELAGDISFGLQYIAREEQLHHLAYYDPLTGLANATLFQDRLGQVLRQAHRGGTLVATVLLDIDRFTYINETLGRHVGDVLLQSVGQRLSQTMRDGDCVARVSADSFAIVVSDLPSEAEVGPLVRERILDAFASPFQVGENEIRLEAHAGISVYPENGTAADVLFKNAESALKQAKLTDQCQFFYGPEINARFAQKLELKRNLRSALDAGQLTVYYQPRVDLTSGKIVAAEALLRWIHPERGVISPIEFIPLAEETGLIVPIGDQVIEMVCAQQAAWLRSQVDVVPIAVNLSGRQLRDSHLVDVIHKACVAHQLDHNHLELEITESVLMENPDAVSAVLLSLRREGLRIALDDFGTGYSSLAYLRRFPIDYLKIDRAFITHLTQEPDDAAIATAIIAMAHRLKLRVVAEGVETEAQLQYLRRHGCDEIQGFYFSPPVPNDAFEAMLRSEKCLPEDASDPKAAKTLLLVDDEPNILSALNRLLRRDGYRILTASSGAMALETLASNEVQVIVSDQRMPEMTGAEFLGIAKELYPDTMRIILSGYTDLTTVTDGINRGAVFKFLTKPWEDELLREHIRDAFRRYRPSVSAD